MSMGMSIGMTTVANSAVNPVMNADTAAGADDQPVIGWPKITATISGETDGTLVINGVLHPCWAPRTDVLRTGMIARCVATAVSLRRPVRVEITESGQSWSVAVRPDGIVQELDKHGRIVGTEVDLLPIEGGCRRCGESNPVTARQCNGCGVAEPLGVLAAEPYAIASQPRASSRTNRS